MTYITLGENMEKPGEQIKLHNPSLLDSCYILGNTGTGKTTLITSMISQNVEQKTGVGIIDPHGDLIDELLVTLHKHLDDVVLLEMTNTSFPFGINLLGAFHGEALDPEKTVSRVMDMFQKVYGIDRDNPHMYEYIINACYTLISAPGYTLADIPLLFTNKGFRQQFLTNLTDYELIDFWRSYEMLKPADQNYEYQSIRNKVNELVKPMMKHIIGQSNSTIDFRRLMDQGKIVLVKLDRELPMMSNLLGSIIINAILNAAFSRHDIQKEKRRQFNLYLDECQRYLTPAMSELLTEARKFGLGTILAHQYRTQLPESLQDATRGAANKIVFRVSGDDARNMVTEFDVKPPPVEQIEIGKKAKLIFKQDVIGELLSVGYNHEMVRTFIKKYLTPLHDASMQKDSSTYTEHQSSGDFLSNDDIEWTATPVIILTRNSREIISDFTPSKIKISLSHLNALMFKIMKRHYRVDHDDRIPVNDLYEFGGRLGFTQERSPDELYIIGYKTAEDILTREDLEELGWAEHYFDSDYRDVRDRMLKERAYKDPENARIRIELCWEFIESFWECVDQLSKDPIMTESGSYEPVYRDIPLKTHKEMQDQVANEIAQFNKGVALVKLTQGSTVTTYKVGTKPMPTPNMKYLKSNREQVLDRMIKEKLVRPQEQVAREIIDRQEKHKPPSAPPPPSV